MSMLNFLETATVYPVGSESWEWRMAQCSHDGHVGYLRVGTYAPVILEPTHRVNVRAATVYSKPSFKFPTLTKLGLWTDVESRRSENGFAEVSAIGWVKESDLVSIETAFNPDNVEDWGPASAAERMKGVLYLWGGRNTVVGVDCSGMTQMALNAVGIQAPRDTDQQQLLGEEEKVPQPGELGSWTRDLLLFWPGHVAVSLGREYLIHASLRHGLVRTQIYGEVVEQRGLPMAARKIAVP
jgi:cell wall-associated NlpC family hydrolase